MAGDREPSEETRLNRVKSMDSARGSKDGDDSDGSKSVKSGRLSKLLKRNEKSKTFRGADDNDTDDSGQRQRGRTAHPAASTTTLGQPPTPGERGSVMTSDDEDEPV